MGMSYYTQALKELFPKLQVEISEEDFGTGLLRFTLYDMQKKPIDHATILMLSKLLQTEEIELIPEADGRYSDYGNGGGYGVLLTVKASSVYFPKPAQIPRAKLPE